MNALLAAIFMFVLGFLLLVKGSDLFVDASARVAKIFGISEFMIGLTLMAVGTSLPELGAGLVASYSGQTEVVLGNVLGSNIANIALILGLSAFLFPLATQKEMFYRDGSMLVFISLLFYYFCYDGLVEVVEGVFLLGVFLLYNVIILKFRPEIKGFKSYVDRIYDLNHIIYLRAHAHLKKNNVSFRSPKSIVLLLQTYIKKVVYVLAGFTLPLILVFDREKRREYSMKISRKLEPFEVGKYRGRLKESLVRDTFMIFFSGAAIYIGSDFLVGGAVGIADEFGIAPRIVAMTLISVGTSIPELAVSLQSAKKGFGEMVVGNILGSNISNIGLVAGICSVVSPLSLGVTDSVRRMNIGTIIPFMIFVSFVSFVTIRTNWSIRRFEGLFFLLLYAGFIFWLITSATIIIG